MSLLVWLPLNGSIKNLGLLDAKITGSGVSVNNNGKIGQCYSFSGSNYISINKRAIVPNASEWTFSCWLYLNDTTTTTATCLFSERTGNNSNGYTIFIYPNTSKILIDDGVRWEVTSVTFTATTWYHFVVTRNPNGKFLYINGELKDSTLTVGTTSAVNANGCLIGYAQSSTSLTTGSQGLKGRLNDVRIYDHCLSNKEVEEISKGLVLHYKLDGKNEVILPSEYLLLEYIERTDGKRILDLETNQAADIHYEMKFQCSTNETNYIFGSKQIGSMAYNGMYRITGQEVNYLSLTLNANNVVNQPIVLMQTLDNTGTTITTTCNGATTTHAFGSLNSGDTDKITFFGIPNSSIRPYGGSIRLYWLRIKNLYGIIRDLVPAKRLSDNQVGMYDIKNNNFLYTNINSNSTTDFTAGPNVLSSGIVYDSSGYLNNGILNTSITVNSNTARYSRSSYFGNYNEPNIILLNTNILPALNNCTVCWWGKYDTTKTLLLTGLNTSTYLAASDANTFYHAAAGSPVMYKNGVLGTYSCVAGTWDFYVLKNVNLSSWTAMKINSYGSGWPLKGYISDFRIYATVLTDDLIKDLYNTSATIDNKGNIYSREYIENSDLNITKTGLFLSNIIYDDDNLDIASILKTEKQILGNTLYEY